MIMNGIVSHSPDAGETKYRILEGQKGIRTGNVAVLNEFYSMFGKI